MEAQPVSHLPSSQKHTDTTSSTSKCENLRIMLCWVKYSRPANWNGMSSHHTQQNCMAWVLLLLLLLPQGRAGSC